MIPFKRTLCASCEYMWDGMGLPCPKRECSDHTTECAKYKRMSDHKLLTFAPQFWDETFWHHTRTFEECERLGVEEWIVFQPVRPLISEITPKQLTIFD